MPDPISSAVDHWYEFTFRDGRDALAFVGELLRQVAAFVDQVLDAFSVAVPIRFRSAE